MNDNTVKKGCKSNYRNSCNKECQVIETKKYSKRNNKVTYVNLNIDDAGCFQQVVAVSNTNTMQAWTQVATLTQPPGFSGAFFNAARRVAGQWLPTQKPIVYGTVNFTLAIKTGHELSIHLGNVSTPCINKYGPSPDVE
jgi:hypothetical protein